VDFPPQPHFSHLQSLQVQVLPLQSGHLQPLHAQPDFSPRFLSLQQSWPSFSAVAEAAAPWPHWQSPQAHSVQVQADPWHPEQEQGCVVRPMAARKANTNPRATVKPATMIPNRFIVQFPFDERSVGKQSRERR